jgi:Leucine Rich repeat
MTSATNPPADPRSCEPPPRPGRRLPHPGWWLLAGLVVCVALLALRFGLPAYRQIRLVEAIASTGGAYSIDYPGSDPVSLANENWLERTIRKGFGTLWSIELRGPSIDDEWLARLSSENNLQRLGFQDTRVTDVGMTRIGKLTQLRVLHLGSANVGDEGLAHLRPLTGLTTFSLGFSAVTDAGLAHIGNMTQLEVLEIYAPNITDAGLAHVGKLTRLKHLGLNGSSITGTGLAQLAGLKSLANLGLVGTRVTDGGVPHIVAMPALKSLSIDRTPMTETGIRALVSGLPGLMELYVSRNQLSADGFDDLKRLRLDLNLTVHDNKK